jgi:sec-independent protein translocase protein TatA
LCYNPINNTGFGPGGIDFMAGFGATELIIILVIVLLLFGVGRIAGVGKELGTGIREFRKGLTGDDEKKTPPTEEPK